MDLNKIREEIDNIDAQIIELYEKRMQCVKDVAEYKRANNKAVYDEKRENEKLEKLSQMVSPEYSDDIKSLYKTIFELSRNSQNKMLNKS